MHASTSSNIHSIAVYNQSSILLVTLMNRGYSLLVGAMISLCVVAAAAAVAAGRYVLRAKRSDLCVAKRFLSWETFPRRDGEHYRFGRMAVVRWNPNAAR